MQNLLNMEYMFSKCKLTNTDFSSFDTTNVITMEGMFKECETSNINISVKI